MEQFIRNLEFSKSIDLKTQVEYKENSIEQIILAKNKGVTMILFSFDKGCEIPTHSTNGNAFVTCIEGIGKIVLNGKEHILNEGQVLVMPVKEPHSVYAIEKFKMLLTIIF